MNNSFSALILSPLRPPDGIDSLAGNAIIGGAIRWKFHALFSKYGFSRFQSLIATSTTAILTWDTKHHIPFLKSRYGTQILIFYVIEIN
jgi:hypothetical protein